MHRVCSFMAEGFEEVEALTVVDLLRRANIDTDMVSISSDKNVSGAHGISIQADYTIEEFSLSSYDMIVLPGGMPGTLHLTENKIVQDAVLQFDQQKKLIAAICAAPSMLGNLGILRGKRAVCYPGFEECLKGAELTGNPVEADGHVITSKGIGTAISFSLVLIEMLTDKETAQKIQTAIQYEC